MCLKGVLKDYNIFIFFGKRARQVILPEGVCDRKFSLIQRFDAVNSEIRFTASKKDCQIYICFTM